YPDSFPCTTLFGSGLVPGDAVAAHHRAGMPELGVALEGEVPVGTAARLVAAREDGPARFGRDGVARAQRGIHAQAQGARPGALRLRVREAGKHRRDERQDEAAGRRVGTTTRGKAGHAVRALAGGEGAATIDYYTKRPAMPGRPRARRRSPGPHPECDESRRPPRGTPRLAGAARQGTSPAHRDHPAG